MKTKSVKAGKEVAILIVEDSPTQALKLQYLLEKNNYRVSVAQNGVKALALLKKFKPTLIISDIVMPEMDGFEFCKKVKTDENLKDIPVILLTRLSEPEDIIKGLESGSDNFVTKPYSDEFILKSIQYILVNREMRQDAVSEMGIELFFSGKKHFITSDRMQILDLLVSTYDVAVQKGRELDIANKELKKTHETLKVFNEQLEQKVDERTQKIKELNSIISAVRNVNQLITREKNRDDLLQSSCECFREISGFNYIWIASIDEHGKSVCSAETGLGEKFPPLAQRLKHGELPICARRALKQSDVVIIEDISTCDDCPISCIDADRGILSIRLEHDEKIYGILTISIPIDIINNKDLQNMFPEVAGDLAFALYSIEQRERHKEAEEIIRNLAKFPEENPMPVMRILRDGTLLFANNAASSMLNTICSEENHRLPDKLIETVSDVYDSGLRQDIEYICGDKIFNFTIVPITDFNYTNIYGFDITERRQTEELIKESRKKFQNLYDEAPVGYHELDREGKILQVNKTEADILGYTIDDLLGKSIFDFIAPEEQEEAKKQLRLKVEKHQPIKEFERKYICKNGEVIDLLMKDKLATDVEGKVTGIRSTLENITERKRAEKQIKSQLEELQRWHNATLGRESRILDLKREVNELLGKRLNP